MDFAAPGSVAIADLDVGAGPAVQHVREIFRCHHQVAVAVDVVGADQLGGSLGDEFGLGSIIDQRRKQYPEIELRGRSEPAGDAGSDTPHIVLDQAQGFGSEGACGAADEGLLRDHIVGVAGVDLRDAENGRVKRPHIA